MWNFISNFLKDPKSAVPLAERMFKHEGFDGDTNVIRRIIYNMPALKKDATKLVKNQLHRLPCNVTAK